MKGGTYRADVTFLMVACQFGLQMSQAFRLELLNSHYKYFYCTIVKIIKKGKGVHFDPDVADAMLSIESEFRGVAEDLRD